jgi:hypothetical protein
MPPKALLKEFLEGYDYLSWAYKASVLTILIEDPTLFNQVKERFESDFGKNVTPSKETLMNFYKMEMHFSAYHSTEALFALIFAFLFQPDLPWLWLTMYTNKNFSDLVHRLSEKGLSLFGKDAKLVARGLFFSVKDEKLNGTIEHSADFAASYIKELAKDFLDRDDYNSYKHGLRTLAAREFKAALGPVNWQEEATTTYLTLTKPTETREAIVRDVCVTIKAIDYVRSKRIIATNTNLMHNLFEIKKAQAIERQGVRLGVFPQEMIVPDVLLPSKSGNALRKATLSSVATKTS